MKKKYELIDYFMIFAIIFFMIVGSMSVFGQTSIGVQSGVAVNVDKHMVGLSINQKWDSTNISTGRFSHSSFSNHSLACITTCTSQPTIFTFIIMNKWKYC